MILSVHKNTNLSQVSPYHFFVLPSQSSIIFVLLVVYYDKFIM